MDSDTIWVPISSYWFCWYYHNSISSRPLWCRLCYSSLESIIDLLSITLYSLDLSFVLSDMIWSLGWLWNRKHILLPIRLYSLHSSIGLQTQTSLVSLNIFISIQSTSSLSLFFFLFFSSFYIYYMNQYIIISIHYRFNQYIIMSITHIRIRIYIESKYNISLSIHNISYSQIWPWLYFDFQYLCSSHIWFKIVIRGV